MTLSSNESARLPDGWRRVRLDGVCEIIAGQSPPGDTYRKVPEGLPFFQGKADFGLRYPIARTWCVSPTKVALPGDILVSVRAPVGPTNVADVECCIGRGLAAIRLQTDADRDFILASLKLFEKQLEKLGSGSTFGAIRINDLASLEIPLPPLAEQKRIAAILNEQMAAVERARAAESQLEAAEALPAAYLRTAFSSPEAQRWPTSQLGELCDIQLGKMLSPASKIGLRPRPYLRNANVQWGKFDLADIARMDFTEDQERKFVLRSGDLLVCEGGEPGRAAVWEGQIPSCLYQKAIHRLRPIGNAVDPHFVMYRLWMAALQREFVESHAKTTIAHLPAVRLRRLPIRVPTVSEQRRIVAMLNERMASAEGALKAIEQELDAINKLPTAILRRAFEGRL